MKLHIKRDKAAGCAAALVLHTVVLYGLWSYHIIPPPSEVLTVFVTNLNPHSPAQDTEPSAPKPAPPPQEKQESARPALPAVPQVLTSPLPVTSSAEPVTSPPAVAKAIPAPPPAITRASTAPTSNPAHSAAPQTVLLTGELSVSCSERPAPAYPKLSSRLGEQGKTVLLVELNELGRVVNIEVKTTSGFPRLDEAAVNTVKTWHCSPAKRNGVAVRAVALQPFNFTLKGR